MKLAWTVEKYGIRLMPEFYEHLNPMPFEAAAQMEKDLAEDWGWLRPAGESLELMIKPIWHDVEEDQRLEFLHTIAMTATRGTNSASI